MISLIDKYHILIPVPTEISVSLRLLTCKQSECDANALRRCWQADAGDIDASNYG